jgi:two-component system, cell cycle sensor histidine kinase and response regulator CckA
MKPPRPPANENGRLATLRSFGVLDTPPEESFDDLVALAAYVCQAPIAVISLVDEERLWFKARTGWDINEIPRAISFCGHAIHEPDFCVIPDTSEDERFEDNPLVAGDPRIRFYAACPLVADGDKVIGTLCVLDYKPRRLHPDHEQALCTLGHHVMALLELRRTERELSEARRLLDADAAWRESAARFSQLADHLDQVFWMTDPAREELLYVSPGFEEIWGRPLERLYDDPREWLRGLHPEDQDRVKDSLLEQAKGSQRLTYRIVRPDGRVRWIQDRAVPVKNEAGEVVRVVGVADDITEQKQVEEALRVSEARYRGVVEGARDGIFTLAPDGTITSANFAFEAMTGWSREEWIGEPFDAMVHPADLPEVMRLFRRMIAGESVPRVPLELRFSVKEGGHVPMELTATPQRIGDRIIGVVGIARDLRERRRMEEELRQIQKMESIGGLASGVAHDFNNLLTVQRAHLSLLLMTPGLDKAAVDHIQEVASAAERAASLTRQLLLFSRKRPIERRRFNLNEVVVTLSRMLDRVVRKDVEIHLDCHEDLPAIEGDPGMMEQVLMNLVVNARDAMPGGGRIEVITEPVTLDETAVEMRPEARAGHFVRLSVRDTGPGIAPEVRRRIFEPFFTTKDVGEGTGLGLSTVYGIVRQHQGWIDVSSTEGVGTTFQVYLPAVRSGLAVGDHATSLPQLEGGSETILAVEDEEALRRIVKSALERYGYRVLMAENGAEALEMWREHRESIDLLLTDLVMPLGLTGWKLAEQLRTEEPDLKVIVMSGYDPTEHLPAREVDAALRQVPFLQKPYGLRELVRTVRECLDGEC